MHRLAITPSLLLFVLCSHAFASPEQWLAIHRNRWTVDPGIADAQRATGVFDGFVGAAHSQVSDEPDEKPKHPTEIATGPKHQILGVIRDVACSGRSLMEIRVTSPKKTVSLYSTNYFKLDLSALGFEPKAEMNPCKDLEGAKARVLYAETSDKSVDGQIVSIELRK